MPAPSLICYSCQRPAVEVSGAVQDCECGCRKMVAAVPIPSTRRADREACQRIARNWQEQAARAEAVAEQLAYAAALVAASLLLSGTKCGDLPRLQKAIDAWSAHRADLDTLEGK